MLSLERKEFADKRGARALAEVVGFGTAFDAPENDGQMIFASTEAMRRAIESCLADASMTARDVDLVASGVSGLKPFDTAELAAIRDVLGEGACISMPKAIVGETLGAGGALALACALGWLQGIAPAAVIAGPPKERVRTVLVTTMGYYGNASAVLVRAP